MRFLLRLLINAAAVEVERSDPAVRSLLPEHIGHKYQAVPLRRDNGAAVPKLRRYLLVKTDFCRR